MIVISVFQEKIFDESRSACTWACDLNPFYIPHDQEEVLNVVKGVGRIASQLQTHLVVPRRNEIKRRKNTSS